jgi:hypothetical protein
VNLLLLIAFGLMVSVLVLWWRYGQPQADTGAVQFTPGGHIMTDLLSDIRTTEPINPSGMAPESADEPPHPDPLVVIGFNPGEDALEISLPRDDLAEAQRLRLAPVIQPDSRGGCVVSLGGAPIARVLCAVLTHADVLLVADQAA